MVAGTVLYDRIRTLISSTSNNDLFGTTVMDHAIEAAVLWHSQFKPKRGIQIGTGSGSTYYYALNSDVIHVRLVENPYGGTPPTYVNAADWHVHRGTAGLELVFESAPGSGDLFAIHYSGEWTLSEIPDSEAMPIAYLACAVLCMREAARMAGNLSPIIDADTVDYRDHSRIWTNLSKQFMNMYASSYGLSARAVESGAPPPAFAVGEVPSHNRYERFWWIT